jgi:hypothetical protein
MPYPIQNSPSLRHLAWYRGLSTANAFSVPVTKSIASL